MDEEAREAARRWAETGAEEDAKRLVDLAEAGGFEVTRKVLEGVALARRMHYVVTTRGTDLRSILVAKWLESPPTDAEIAEVLGFEAQRRCPMSGLGSGGASVRCTKSAWHEGMCR